MNPSFLNFSLAVTAAQYYILEEYYKHDLQVEKAFYADVRKENLLVLV